jgi:hypothetical protein
MAIALACPPCHLRLGMVRHRMRQRARSAAGARDGCPKPFDRMPRKKGGRPLRSAASSSRADEAEEAAATVEAAQAVEEARRARRARTSAGTDAGAVPPQARRRSIACLSFRYPVPRPRYFRMDISLAVTATWALFLAPPMTCRVTENLGGFLLLLFNPLFFFLKKTTPSTLINDLNLSCSKKTRGFTIQAFRKRT